MGHRSGLTVTLESKAARISQAANSFLREAKKIHLVPSESGPRFASGMFGRVGEKLLELIPRSQALKNLYAEARQLGVEIRSGDEANAFLDHAANMEGVSPESMHAVTLGKDLIFVRETHINDVRVLREELLHTQQQTTGFEISKISQTNAELSVREKMISHAYEWGITDKEIQEMQKEINTIKVRGGY